jgi:hypothetical protein
MRINDLGMIITLLCVSAAFGGEESYDLNAMPKGRKYNDDQQI